jgi:hypothetical protein
LPIEIDENAHTIALAYDGHPSALFNRELAKALSESEPIKSLLMMEAKQQELH